MLIISKGFLDRFKCSSPVRIHKFYSITKQMPKHWTKRTPMSMKKRDLLNSIKVISVLPFWGPVSFPYCDILMRWLEDKCYMYEQCKTSHLDTRNSRWNLDSYSEDKLYVAFLRSMVFFLERLLCLFCRAKGRGLTSVIGVLSGLRPFPSAITANRNHVLILWWIKI